MGDIALHEIGRNFCPVGLEKAKKCATRRLIGYLCYRLRLDIAFYDNQNKA